MIKQLEASEDHFQQLFSFLKTYQPHGPHTGSYELCVEFYTLLIQHERVTLFVAYQAEEFLALFTPMSLEGASHGMIQTIVSPKCSTDQLHALLERSISFLKGHQLSTAQIICRNTDPDSYRTSLHHYGFRLKDKSFLSEYLCEQDIPPSLLEKEATFTTQYQGQCLTLEALKAQDDEWETKWYTFEQETVLDVPSETPMEKMRFEDWKMVILNRVKPDSCVLFLVIQQEIVGLLHAFKSGGFYFIEFTGVARAYRRKGFSSLLKIHLIQHAKAHKLQGVRTMNHQANPMLKLNQAFGFKVLEILDSYSLDLT